MTPEQVFGAVVLGIFVGTAVTLWLFKRHLRRTGKKFGDTGIGILIIAIATALGS